MISYALSNDIQVYLPKIIDMTRMDFYRIDSLNNLKRGKMGIMEPEISDIHRYNGYPISKVNDKMYKGLIVVPGIAYDNNLNRIGYGRGYYDRYLPSLSGFLRVGICYDELIIDALPIGELDQPVDIVLTEKRIIT